MNLFGRDGIEHVDLAPERQRELAGLLPAGHPHVRPGAGDVDGVGRDVLDHAAHAGPGGGGGGGGRNPNDRGGAEDESFDFFLFRGGRKRTEGEMRGKGMAEFVGGKGRRTDLRVCE